MADYFAIQPHYLANNESALAILEPQNRQRVCTVDGSICIIRVDGVLWHRYSPGYIEIGNALSMALADYCVKTILLDIDSPGGQVAGVFDLADRIFEARKKKKIIAVANESAFSAAYLLASGSDRIYLPRTGQVGSIGVIAVHVDVSEYDKKVGLGYTLLKAGKQKDHFNPHKPLGSEARQSAQRHVDRLMAMMCETIGRNRNISPYSIKGTEAGLFMGADAVKIGLADGVRTFGEVLVELKKGNEK